MFVSKSHTLRAQVVPRTAARAGIDGRSTEARRYKDLVIGWMAQFGLRSDSDVALVETAAAIKIRIETLTSAMCSDQRVDVSEIGRLSSELRHILSDLKRGATANAAPPNPAFANVLCGDEADDEGGDD